MGYPRIAPAIAIVVASTAIALAAPAPAAPAPVEGRYVHSEGSLEVTRIGPNRLKLRVQTISGPSAHICDLEVEAALAGDLATHRVVGSSHMDTCVLEVRFHGDQAHVRQEGSCDCGARGTMAGTYLRKRTLKGPAPHPMAIEAAEAERAEARTLLALYRNAERAYAAAPHRQRLAASQAAWSRFLDAHGEFTADLWRGEPWGLVLRSIERRATHAARSAQMRAALSETKVAVAGEDARMHEALARADRQLNERYKELRGRLDGPARQKLLTAQLAWLKYRDAECAFQVRRWAETPRGLEPMCLAGLTEARVAQLEAALEAREQRQEWLRLRGD